MFNDRCGGGKGSGSSYDPQIGAATQQTAATAARAVEFQEKYYTDVVAPLLRQQTESAATTTEKLNTLYDLNAEQMRLAADRYQKYGIPAEERYYEMARTYSEPEEMERQAQAAKGDLGQAMANQRGTLMRQQGALGIDPTSPAAQAMASDMALQGAAIEAGAMNRARNAARTLGMQLTSDAANFGRGGQSGILQFGAGAQGNAAGAFGVANQALSTGAGASSGMQQAFGNAISGYGSNANIYAGLGKAEMEANAAASAGFWGGVGSMVGTGAGLAIRSDRRLKENIVDIGATLPSGIKLYMFNYIGDDTTQIGVMAQEVQAVIPEAVVEDADGFMSVYYGMLR